MSNEISPLDGRYAARLRELGELFSERALMGARTKVEIRWALTLARAGLEGGLFPPLPPEELQRLEAAAEEPFTEERYGRIKAIEARIKHDVKACERALIERLGISQPQLIHFGLTSEDANNLAHSLLLNRYRRQQQLPLLERLMSELAELVERWKAAPFPARTHGQLASPTTAGKELAVFLHRLLRQHRQLRAFRFRGKLNGATGNYSALVAAFPRVDWRGLSKAFVEGLGLEHNPITTQIEDHDGWSEYFSLTARINAVVLDMDCDLWSYISRGYLVQRPKEGEVGSSTMPHKVNPINFENSEGNLTLSTALLRALSDKLTRSRMQRDLSDSTVERNIGVALAHGHLAMTETLIGLSKIELDRERCRAELEAAPELLAEPYQTILKTAGVADPYELLREASRGVSGLSMADLKAVVAGLELPDEVVARLNGLTPLSYVGLAEELCDQVLEELGESKGRRSP